MLFFDPTGVGIRGTVWTNTKTYAHMPTTYDQVICWLYLCTAMWCLFHSASYHLFCCHTETTYNRVLCLDMSGIALLIGMLLANGWCER